MKKSYFILVGFLLTSIAYCQEFSAPAGEAIPMSATWISMSEKGFQVGTFSQIIGSDTIQRRYLYYLPKGYTKNREYPVIYLVHGAGMNAEMMSNFMQGEFESKADRDGIILVYGNCYPSQPMSSRSSAAFVGTWNKIENGVFSPTHSNTRYFELVEQDLKKKIQIDLKNLFIIGASDGAALTSRILEAYPKKYKGAGMLIGVPYTPEKRITSSLYIFYSEGDPLAETVGIPNYKDKMLQSTLTWTNNLGIDVPGDSIQFSPMPDKIIEMERYSGTSELGKKTFNSKLFVANLISKDGKTMMRVLKSDRSGHNIPYPEPASLEFAENVIGFKNRDLNTFEDIWNFFIGLTD